MTDLILVLLIFVAFWVGRLYQWVRDARNAMGTPSRPRSKSKRKG
ncbi:hypothetical protein [Frankia sp. BMG5.23]|nr:hypothetical protein [Frankia sp. BMG5.23]KDA44518.1 hypothetical protein BMG523Draft_00695 [Frankia sp. BMG5.23]